MNPTRHKLGLLMLAVWLGAAAVAACAGAQQGDQAAARADAAKAAQALEAAYKLDGHLVIASGQCDGMTVDTCPALQEVRNHWRPVLAAWDVYAAALEGGADTESLRKAYCVVLALAPRAGLPQVDCAGVP